MTNDSLSIHVDSGDVFQQNYNTGENFYKFLLGQQDDHKAFLSKKFSYRNSFEKSIDSFLPSFSIDDIENLDLYAKKSSKYLFDQFNDYSRVPNNRSWNRGWNNRGEGGWTL